METRTWKTEDGRKLNIQDMETLHIINTYKMLKRNGWVSVSTLDFYLSTEGPSGEMAQMAFEQELHQIMSAPCCKALDWFEEELNNRKIEIPKD